LGADRRNLRERQSATIVSGESRRACEGLTRLASVVICAWFRPAGAARGRRG
jgi:hypothetical protein